MRSDVAQFYDALDRDDLAAATALYTAPFLDGFYLSGATEFGRWADETSARLQFAAVAALETLRRHGALALRLRARRFGRLSALQCDGPRARRVG